jgi:hypothetical protein
MRPQLALCKKLRDISLAAVSLREKHRKETKDCTALVHIMHTNCQDPAMILQADTRKTIKLVRMSQIYLKTRLRKTELYLCKYL